MPIIQREFEAGGYHVANDAPFLDSNLKWESKGVLGYLFSKPADWTPRMYDIVQQGPCEKYKIKSVFEDLENHGYLYREKVRVEGGKFDWKITVSDHPRFLPGWTESSPESVQPGQNRGYNNTEFQSDGYLPNTESEGTHTHERKSAAEAPLSIEEAVSVAEENDVPARVAKKWWHHHNARGWNRPIKSVASSLLKWNLNEEDFHPNGASPPESVEDLRGKELTEIEVQSYIEKFDDLERSDFGFTGHSREDVPLYALTTE